MGCEIGLFEILMDGLHPISWKRQCIKIVSHLDKILKGFLAVLSPDRQIIRALVAVLLDVHVVLDSKLILELFYHSGHQFFGQWQIRKVV
jgi:hypothetical protein